MAGCCHDDQCATFEGQSPAYRRALWAVVAINGAMFATELAAGAMAQSMALQADALDFLADTLTYGISLYAIGRSARLRAGVAMAKGISLAAMGVGILALVGVDAHHLNPRLAREPLADLEPGRARLTVDEDARLGRGRRAHQPAPGPRPRRCRMPCQMVSEQPMP